MTQERGNMSKESEKKSSSSSLFNLKDIGVLLEMLTKHEVREFEFERDGEKLSLKRGGVVADEDKSAPRFQQVFTPSSFSPQPYASFYPQGVSLPSSSTPEVSAKPSIESDAEKVEKSASSAVLPTVSVPDVQPIIQPQKPLAEVSSPMVGTFYRRPAVDAEPYVQEGDVVKKGQVLCIVEAMKLMNEIESDVSGTIVEICLEDGQMVEYGETLFRIAPSK